MPEWLLEKDNYIPPNDRDAFINRSILSILGVLSKLKLRTDLKSKRALINPTLRLGAVMLVVLLTSLSQSHAFVFAIDAFLLMLVSMLRVKDIKYILKMGLLVSFFSLIIMLPSIMLGNKNGLFIVIKVITTVTVLNILTATTSWSDITCSLKLLHIPDIFILVLDITMKYILILGEFSLNMLYALKLKSIGKSRVKNSSLSGIIGTMFIKSKDMAEEMYSAMECRGFTGEYSVRRKYKLGISDVIFVIINIMVILIYFYFDRL